MPPLDFAETFKALTGYPPFPWQTALFDLFMKGEIPPSCNLPTGLGKTSIIGVWLIAWANCAPVPRRLVYVVNRRTVVDQTTEEVKNYRKRLAEDAELKPLKDKLGPLALSTLRGQLADNREWSADPSRPAVISGTVDMIGSRLLFSGYGIGYKQRPLHAGFLGQDSLLVHDEAHLEPAFQGLIKAIEKEQRDGERTGTLPWPKLQVMELTATSRGGSDAFGLTKEDKENRTVNERINARKALCLHPLKDEKKLAEQVAELALRFQDSGRAVLVFVRTVDDVMKVRDKLPKGTVETLTGTMRGKERDDLASSNNTFARFLPSPPADAKQGTVYLVCTSAGEVGVNISADHLVCDLSTFESMAQRFGRVNRFGSRHETEIHLVHPTEFDPDKSYEIARERTLGLLKLLPTVVPYLPGEWFQASPAALGELDATARQAAFAPAPTILPVTDILFDAWSLTTIREKLPGRPKVEPYLHGLVAGELPETHVAWREEVERLQPEYANENDRKDREAADRKTLAKLASELLDDYPLKPHELLREPSYLAFKELVAMAKRCPDLPAWLLDDEGNVEVLTVGELADKDEKERIEGKILLLPPSAGGLEGGMFSGSISAHGIGSMDIADNFFSPVAKGVRLRIRAEFEDDDRAKGMRLIREVELPTNGSEDEKPDIWFWFSRENEGEKSTPKPVEWHVHVKDVVDRTKDILADLLLPDDLKEAVIVAADLHDHGKRRRLFQRVLGNVKYPEIVLGKSGGTSGGRVAEIYRHEFGSLLEVSREQGFNDLSEEGKEVVLHLIATHHGRARPHFPAGEAFDPEQMQTDAEKMAISVPRRFARLQRKYGRWGLAYLESLLRAADWAASANPSKYLEGEK